MTALEDGLAARAAWARDVALFRYEMIRAAADPDLSPQQRGALVRASAVVVAEPGELAVKHTEHLVLAGVWTDNPAG